MKTKFPEIDMKRFYLIGKYCFFTTFLIGVIRLIDLWSSFKPYDLVGSIAMTLFQFALFGFFAYMSNKQDIAEVNDGDIIKMNEALDNLNLGGKEINQEDGKKG
jgi:hypothetical protein